MKLFRYLLLVVSSFVFISLNGCVDSKSPYDRPPEWFKPEKQQESCPDLAGTYDNMSVVDPDTFMSKSLFNRLITSLSMTYSLCYACTVDIRWFDDEKNTLSVTIADPTGNLETTTRQLKKLSGDFRCENGTLIIDYKSFFELVLVGGYMSGTNRFYKGSDGTVMCEQNYSSFGHQFYFIPIFYSAVDQTNFLRWEQYSSTPLKLLTPEPIRKNELGQIDQSQFYDFRLSVNEKTAYFGKAVIASSSIISHWSFGECWNGKVLLTDKYIYLIQKPLSNITSEYQLKINDCGLALIKPEKSWKIPFDSITQVDSINEKVPIYRLYVKDSDGLTTSIFIRVDNNEKKLFEDILMASVAVNINRVSPSTWSIKYNDVFYSLQPRKELITHRYGCNKLSRKWVERTQKGIFWINPVERPPFWKRAECLTQSGFWSRDRTIADTIYDANENNLLYIGDYESNNNCGPYPYSWVSTEEIEVDVCKGNWIRVDGKEPLPCQNSKIKLRRLAIGNAACYLYGDKIDPYIRVDNPHDIFGIKFIYGDPNNKANP